MSDFCKICGLGVDSKSGQQSEFANWIQCHQECMRVYLAVAIAKAHPSGETGGADAIDEMLFHTCITFCGHSDLTMPYFAWQMALYSHLLKNPKLFEELEKLEKEGRENDRKNQKPDVGTEIPTPDSENDSKPS